MQLSYTMRLICLALCSIGLLHLLLECAAWQAGSVLFRRTMKADPRRAERSLFLLALFGRLGSPLLVLGVWVPAYVRGEENASGEAVGLFCLLGAACVLAWGLLCWARVLRAWIGTRRRCALARPFGISTNGLPVLLAHDPRPFVAVVGVVRPRILISHALFTSGQFSAEALDLVLQHEHAHARRRDNLKLLILSLLPHLPLATARQLSLDRLWRLAAELVADEEGSGAQPERSLLLAELLVKMAGETTMQVPGASFGLLSRGEELRIRVDRLLERSIMTVPAMAGSGIHLLTLRTIAACTMLLVLLCCLCAGLGHRAAEVLLHAGSHMRPGIL